MVGILLVTHNGLGDSLLDCVRHVIGHVPPHLRALSVLADDDPAAKEMEGLALIRALDQGDGVLVLTDLFGATPSNISSRLCKNDGVRGVAGVNLPMLLRTVVYRDQSLEELSKIAIDGGRDYIVPIE
ncbi:MAG TPA: PTS fructose transporter subunit IIA [Gallionellaceae bacterium]|nr:PTS fructose transporter subunit IIA [Gallionellaceae bacterium]